MSKISKRPLVKRVTDAIKIPTGEVGDLVMNVGQLRGYIQQIPFEYANKLIVLSDATGTGQTAGGLLYAWPKILCDLLNWELIANSSIAGSDYASNGTTTSLYINRVNTIPIDYNGHVIINDFYNTGTLGHLGTLDDNTVYGAVDKTICAILDRSDSLKLWVTIPYEASGGFEGMLNSNGWTYKTYRDAVRHVVTRLQRLYDSRLEIIDAERDFSELYSRSVLGNGTGDGALLSPSGHSVFARYVAGVITGDEMVTQRDVMHSVNFSTLPTGNLNGVGGWTVESGSYVIGSNGLTVNAVFSSHTNGALYTTPTNARSVRMLVEGKAVLSWRKQGGSSFAIWTYGSDGNIATSGWNYGTVATNNVFVYTPQNNTLSNAVYWLELEQDGGFLNARVWSENSQRPLLPLATRLIASAEAEAHPLLGSIGITSTSTDNVIVKQIVVYS